MSEFDIIAEYFNRQKINRGDVAVGIGDDAAIIDVSSLNQLAISIDTLISGVHFPHQTSAYDIGWKALAVNLSDMAAMGAEPLWFTLALTLPEANRPWLSDFAAGLFDLAGQHNVQLVGGDTTRGPLSITIQIAGNYPDSNKMQRSNALPGDLIYVTGFLGDAALGLLSLSQELPLSHDEKQHILGKLNRPEPRVKEALAFRSFVSAAIDISDGLQADLSHILTASGVGAKIQVDKLPVSRFYRWCCQGENMLDLALSGGDDYELCVTVSPQDEDEFLARTNAVNCQVSQIGEITKDRSLQLLTQNQALYTLKKTAYDHFKNHE